MILFHSFYKHVFLLICFGYYNSPQTLWPPRRQDRIVLRYFLIISVWVLNVSHSLTYVLSVSLSLTHTHTYPLSPSPFPFSFLNQPLFSLWYNKKEKATVSLNHTQTDWGAHLKEPLSATPFLFRVTWAAGAGLVQNGLWEETDCNLSHNPF